MLKKTGDINYGLKLPPKYKIHPVFYIELLTTYTPFKLLLCNTLMIARAGKGKGAVK